MYSFYWLISLFPFLWIRKWPPFVSEWKKSGLQTHSLRTIEWGNPWSQLGLVTEHQQQWLEMIPYQEANFDLPQAGAHRRACPGGRWGPSSKSQGTQSWPGRNTGRRAGRARVWLPRAIPGTGEAAANAGGGQTNREKLPVGVLRAALCVWWWPPAPQGCWALGTGPTQKGCVLSVKYTLYCKIQ